MENPMKKWLISGYPHDLGNLRTTEPRSGPPCHRGSCDAGGNWRDGRRVWAAGPLAPAFMAYIPTWGRGWMTKASGVGERRKGRGEWRRDCHHRVAALFVPTRMQQWYIDIWYITMIYMGEGAGGGPFAGKITWCPWGAPEYVLSKKTLASWH